MWKPILLILVSVHANAASPGRRCECECWQTPKRGQAAKLCPVSSEIVERTVGNYRCEPDWLVRKDVDSIDACRVYDGQLCNGYTMGERMKKSKGRLKGCGLK